MPHASGLRQRVDHTPLFHFIGLPRNSDKGKQCKFSWRKIVVYIRRPPSTLFKKSYLPYCGLRAHEDGRPCSCLSIAHRGRWLHSASFGALSGVFFGSSTFHHCCCLEQSFEEESLPPNRVVNSAVHGPAQTDALRPQHRTTSSLLP
jgi:hypothetical protein